MYIGFIINADCDIRVVVKLVGSFFYEWIKDFDVRSYFNF